MIVENKPVSICITIINSYTVSQVAVVEIAKMAANMHANSSEQTGDPIRVF